MFFWICLAVSIIFTALAIIFGWEYLDIEGLNIASWIIAVIGWIATIIMLIVIIASHTGVGGFIASNQERYNSLVYQAENNLYENDNDLGKKELVNQIQKWNEDVSKGKKLQNDLWLGIFYPDVYDQFQTIPLDTIQ